jgi:hypothetical protein
MKKGDDLNDLRQICGDPKYKKIIAGKIAGRFGEFSKYSSFKLVDAFCALQLDFEVLRNFAIIRRMNDESEFGVEKEIDEWIFRYIIYRNY